MELRSPFRNLVLIALVAAVAGCGIDHAPLPIPPRGEIEELIEERSFRTGEVEITEQIFLTNADRSQVFHLRAQLTNLGPDIEGARYELLIAREKQIFSQLPQLVPRFELAPPEVADTQQLGTLHSSQTALVSLTAREFGAVRVQAAGRFATTTSPPP